MVRDGVVQAEAGWEAGRNHAEQFLSVLAGIMERLGIAAGELDLIAVGCGPGSYTGLRIGIAMAEAISFTLGCRICGVDSLAALAENGAGFPGYICPAFAARRGRVYAAVYKDGAAVAPPASYTREALVGTLAELEAGPLLLLGDAAAFIGTPAALARLAPIAGRPEQNRLRGAVLARLGARDPARPARPAYLKKTEAEERRDRPDGEAVE